MVIVTNNLLVYDNYKGIHTVIYLSQGSLLDVLIKSRDMAHMGYSLLTHPLSSNLKTNQTPYKTIIMSEEKKEICYNKIRLIESAIDITKRLKTKEIADVRQKILEDYRLVDMSIIENGLNCVKGRLLQ